jgi:hypothetical protein
MAQGVYLQLHADGREAVRQLILEPARVQPPDPAHPPHLQIPVLRNQRRAVHRDPHRQRGTPRGTGRNRHVTARDIAASCSDMERGMVRSSASAETPCVLKQVASHCSPLLPIYITPATLGGR